MAELNSVNLVEVSKVAPQPPSSSSPDSATPPPRPPHSLPLTLFDLLWLRSSQIRRLFFYEISPSNFTTNPSFFHSTLIPKLKTSLSLTLQQFLPLAGNITWPQHSPKPILSYVQGDGVSLTIAQSDHNFDHLMSSNNFDIEAKEYHPLVPNLAVSHEKAAALAFQVTIFPNRGFCIGTSMHHAIVDGKTSTMFVKSWAHICKHIDDESDSNIFLPDQLKPFFERSVIRDPAGLEPIYSNQFLKMDGPNNRSLMSSKVKAPLPDSVRGTFVFTRAKTEALRKLVKEKKPQQHDHHHQSVHLSTFSLTCAYTWVCLVKAEEIKSGKALLGFSADCRSRLDPIPANYVGNCLMPRLAVAEAKALSGEDGLTVAVSAISEAIKSLDTDGLFNGAENWIKAIYSVGLGTHERFLPVSGSPRFENYETDFGWGRPKKAEIVSIDGTRGMSLSQSKDGDGGVDVGLVLKKHHMEAFASLFAKGLGNL